MFPVSRVLALGLLAVALQPKENPRDDRAIDRQIATGRRLRETGNFLQASRLLARAAETAHANGYLSGEAHALLAQGACRISLFQYRSALRALQEAERLGTALGDAVIEGAASLNEATAYAELGDFALGLEHARRSVALFRTTAHRDYTAQALLVQANLQAQAGRIDEALPAYSGLIRLCQGAHLPAMEASAWEDEGEALLDAGRWTAAEECLNRAYSLRSRQKLLSSLAVTVYNLAELRLKQGRYTEGLHFLDQADSFPGTILSEIPSYELFTTRGELFAALGRRQSALAQFYQAVLSADRLRAASLPATRLHTVVHLHQVYEDYVNLAAQEAVRTHDQMLARRALGVLARSRAAAYRDELKENLNREGRLPAPYLEVLAQLQEAQSQSTLNGKPTPVSSSRLRLLRLRLAEMENRLSLQTGIRELPVQAADPSRVIAVTQAHLRPTELLLSVSLGVKASYLWAVTSREIHLYQVPNRERLEQTAESFAQSVRNNKDVSTAGLTFAAALIGPLPLRLLSYSDWLLAADGKLLDGIPFSALPVISSGQGKREPLVLRHTLRLLPSGDGEQLVQFGSAPFKFLGIGDPIYNRADPRWQAMTGKRRPPDTEIALARLVASRSEIEAAAKGLHPSSAELLFGVDASLSKLSETLSHRPNILHFAVHVVSPPGQPQEAALALSLSPTTGVPALLTPERIALYRVPGSLIVLSGCTSQQGAILPIVGVNGLSRSWLIAGAGAVVVSAWPTLDTGGQFFTAFYQAFRMDTTDPLSRRAAMALHIAQRHLALAAETHQNTALWAAYSVIATE